MSFRAWALRLGIPAIVAIVVLSCDASSIILEVQGVPDTLEVRRTDSGVVELSELTLTVGDSAALSAVALDAKGDTIALETVTWSVDPAGVVTASQEGTVVALAPGTATITSSVRTRWGEVSAIVPVTVVNPPSSLGALDVSPTSVELHSIGATVQLSAAAVDSASNPIVPLPRIVWASSGPGVATVSDALVTARGAGSTFITASNSCCSPDSAQIVVTLTPPPAGSLDWFCDWSYGVGDALRYVNGRGVTTQAQHLDECFGNSNGGPYFPYPELKIVPKDSSAAPSGWPSEMKNLLRTSFSNTFGGSPMVWSDSIIEPDNINVGDAVFVRGYFSDESEAGASINAHPFHYGYGGNGQPCPDYGGNCYSSFFHWDNEATRSDGTIPNPNIYLMEGIDAAGGGQGNFAIGWNGESLQTHHVYRFELRFHRSHSDSVGIAVRIYDETVDGSSLLYDEGAWGCSTGGCFIAGGYGGGGSPIYLGDRRVGMRDMRRLAAIEIGNNGSEAMDPPTPQNIYWGGLAVRLSADSSAWIGPYPVGPEVN